MTLQDIRDHLHAEHFQPFTLRLADGRRLDVAHPDFAAIPPGNLRTVVVYTLDRRMHTVDLFSVTDLKTSAPADPELPSPPAPDNGNR